MQGRDAELAVLGEALAALRSGRGRTVLIEGEAGIGKSALLAAAFSGSAAEDDGVAVLRGGCDELTRRFPLSAMAWHWTCGLRVLIRRRRRRRSTRCPAIR